MYKADDRGVLNAFPRETADYNAEYPSPVQQRRYALQGAVATLFVGLLLATAFVVS
jgi:hypothetical protein